MARKNLPGLHARLPEQVFKMLPIGLPEPAVPRRIPKTEHAQHPEKCTTADE
jgi:hypothetical protein